VNATVRLSGWEGTGSRVNHEPENLPGELTIVPSWAGEQARMKKRVQSSGSQQGLGDFLFGLPDYPSESVDRVSTWSRPAVGDLAGACRYGQ
jgi:hypothetical protein